MLRTVLLASLDRQFGIAATIGRVEFDAARLSVALQDVSLAAHGHPREPFLRAGEVRVDLTWSALWDGPALEELVVRRAAVSVVRRGDGSSNLPASGDGANETGRLPVPVLPIERLDITGLTVDWRDEYADFAARLPPTTVRLSPRGGGGSGGTVAFDGGGSATWRGWATRLARLRGEIEFDGAALGIRRLALSGPELDLRLYGRLEPIFANPRISIEYEADAALEWVAALLSAPPAAGRLSAVGEVSGTVERLEVSSELAGDAIEFNGVEADRVDASVRVTPAGVELDSLRVELAGGVLTAAGSLARDADRSGRFDAAWSGVDVDRLLAAFRADAPVVLDAAAEGSLAASWTALDPRSVVVSGGTRLVADGASGAGVSIEGSDGRWHVTLDQTLADAVSVSGSMDTALAADALAGGRWNDAPLAGSLNLTCNNLGACSRLLDAARGTGALAPLDGTAGGRFELGGTLGRPVLSGMLEAYGLTAGPATLDSAEARLHADVDGLRADDVQLRAGPNAATGGLRLQPPDGALDGAFTAVVSDLGAVGLETPPGWAAAGRGQVRITIGGSIRQVEAAAAFEFDGIEVAGVDVGAVAGHAVLDAGSEVRADLRAPELGATVAASLSGPAAERRFRLRGRTVDADIARLAPPSAALAGRMTLAVDADGPLDNLAASALEVRIGDAEASMGGLPVHVARPAVISYGADGLRAEDLELVFGRSRLRAGGGLRPAGDEALEVVLAGRVADLAAVAGPLSGLPPGSLDGRIRVELSATGAPDAVDLAGSLELDDGAIAIEGRPGPGGITARATLADGLLRIASLRAAWAGATIEGSAELPIEFGSAWLPATVSVRHADRRRPAAARFDIDALTPAVLAGYLDPAALDRLVGAAGGTVELELSAPDLASTRGRLTLSEAAFVAAGIPFAQRQTTEIVLENGFAAIRSFDWGNETSRLAVAGRVPLAGDAGADLSLTGDLDLRALGALVPALGALGAAAAGSARVDARLTGPLASPDASGRVELADGELRVAEPRLTLTDLNGALRLAGNRVTADNLTGSANGGRVTIRGGWSFAGAGARNAFTIAGEGLALEIPSGLRSEADVDLELASTGDGLALTGAVDLLRGAYREPFVLAGGLFELLGREPGVATIEAGGGDGADVQLDVRVVTGDDIVVANNYLDAELGGDLRVGGTLRAPAVTGRAALREGGRVRFGNRTYEIDTGAVDFIDPDGIVPALTLEAHTRAGGYDITLEASGSGGDWSTSLRSEPPLPESDIASVLLTGRPLDQAAVGLAADAREQALGLASSELLAQVGRGIGVDVRIGADGPAYDDGVLFDPSLIATDLNPASRLTVGRDLRDNVRLVFSRGLRDDDMAWLVDYLPRNNVEVRALFDDERRRAYEFRHVTSAGAPERGAATARAAARARPEVAAVEVRGEPGVDAGMLRELLALESGDTFDFHRWQDDRETLETRLRELGFLEARVRARRTPRPAGTSVDLTYEVTLGPRTRLRVTGYPLPDSVRRELEAIWSRAVFDTFLTEELTARVTAHLAGEGYLRAAIDVQAGGDPAAEVGGAPRVKEVAVSIDPGPRSDTRRLVFEGVAVEEQAALQALAAATGLDAGAWIDPEPLATAVRDWYRGQGRLRAAVEVGEARFTDRDAELPVLVAAGAQYHIGQVRVSGTRSRSELDVREAAAIRRGDVYTEAAVLDARRRIAASYRRAGHAAVRVSAESVVADPSHTVEVRLEVVEGPLRVIEQVVVEGAPRTHPTLVARALDLQPGGPVDPLAWNLARRRLYETGVFRSVDIVARELPAADDAGADASTPVEARVTLEEWPPYRLRYGLRLTDEAAALGESTGRTLRVGAGGDFTRRNLFGRGLTAGVSAHADRGRQALRAFLTVPTLLGRDVETNLFAARRRARTGPDAADFVANATTFTVEQRMRPSDDVTFAYSANLDLNDAVEGVPGHGFSANPRGRVARFDASAVADSRNDLFNATSGLFHSSNVEYGSELGRAARYLKYLGQQFAYRRLGNVVLASAARIGLATGFGSPLHLTERFFAGGGNTVRGYGQDSLGPLGSAGAPTGGRALLILNQEARFPLWRRFSGVGFFDAGNVFHSLRDIALDDLRFGTGFGLRFDSPLGLVRADYGFPLRSRERGQRGRLFISLGQAF